MGSTPISTRSMTDCQAEIKEKLAQSKSDADAKKSGLASQEHHQANPGPVSRSTKCTRHVYILTMQVIAENLGEPASKEELKKRSEELNKK